MSVLVTCHLKNNYPNRDESLVESMDVALELLRAKHAIQPLEERYGSIEIVTDS